MSNLENFLQLLKEGHGTRIFEEEDMKLLAQQKKPNEIIKFIAEMEIGHIKANWLTSYVQFWRVCLFQVSLVSSCWSWPICVV